MKPSANISQIPSTLGLHRSSSSIGSHLLLKVLRRVRAERGRSTVVVWHPSIQLLLALKLLLRLVLIGHRRRSAPTVRCVVELGGPGTPLAQGAGRNYKGVSTIEGGRLASGARDRVTADGGIGIGGSTGIS